MKAFTRLTAAAALLAPPVALAIQPVEVGLQPALARLEAIQIEKRAADRKLQEPESTAEDRFDAYQRFKLLEVERLELEADISRVRRWAAAPLINFASDLGGTQ